MTELSKNLSNELLAMLTLIKEDKITPEQGETACQMASQVMQIEEMDLKRKMYLDSTRPKQLAHSIDVEVL